LEFFIQKKTRTEEENCPRKRNIALEVLLFYFFNLQVADGLSDVVAVHAMTTLEVLLFYFFNLQVADGLSDVVAVHAMTNTSTVPESVVDSAAR